MQTKLWASKHEHKKGLEHTPSKMQCKNGIPFQYRTVTRYWNHKTGSQVKPTCSPHNSSKDFPILKKTTILLSAKWPSVILVYRSPIPRWDINHVEEFFLRIVPCFNITNKMGTCLCLHLLNIDWIIMEKNGRCQIKHSCSKKQNDN